MNRGKWHIRGADCTPAVLAPSSGVTGESLLPLGNLLRARPFVALNSWHVASRYTVALGAVSLALVVRWLLDPIVGDRMPFATLFVALLPLLLLVRPRTFFVASTLGLVASWYFFVPPRFSFGIPDSAALVQVSLYIASVLAAGLAAWQLHRAHTRFWPTNSGSR